MGGGNFDHSQMQQMLAFVMGMMNAEKEKDKGEREKGTRGRVILDEKHFRRMDVFEGVDRDTVIGDSISTWPLGPSIKTWPKRLTDLLRQKIVWETNGIMNRTLDSKRNCGTNALGNCTGFWYP